MYPSTEPSIFPREKHISDTFPHHHGLDVKPHLTLQIMKIGWVGGGGGRHRQQQGQA
jgi:hypothetical protein